MSARTPYDRLERRPPYPPYVKRKAPDDALDQTSTAPSKQLALLGNEPAMGVSRTLRAFVDRISGKEAIRGNKRYPVVVDLFPHAHLTAVETLVLARNALVERVNQAMGISHIGKYLLPFDTAYLMWLSKNKIAEHHAAVKLVQTKLQRFEKKAMRVSLRLFTAGLSDLVGSLGDLAVLIGEHALKLVDAATEQASEDLIERGIGKVHRLIKTGVLPRFSPRLLQAFGDDEVRDEQYHMIMWDLLATALREIQQDLSDQGLFILAADGIDAVDEIDEVYPRIVGLDGQDETDDEDKEEAERLRWVVTNLLINGSTEVSGIFCGRAPADKWLDEAGKDVPAQRLGLLPAEDVRATLGSAGLDGPFIDRIMAALRPPGPVRPGTYSAAYRKFANTTTP